MMITVQGSATQFHQPERAVLRLQVSVDGPDRAGVLEQVATGTSRVQAMIQPLTEGAAPTPVTRWNANQVHVDAQRPWNNEGIQQPLVYTATVDFEVRFADFEALNTFFLDAANIDGVNLHGISWELTEPSQLALTQKVQGLAVQNAKTKALTYARAAGEQDVRFVALADVGMLGGDGGQPGPVAYGDAMMRSAKAGGPEISLKPQDIELICKVDAKFETTAGPRSA